jgi:hypothetical protein
MLRFGTIRLNWKTGLMYLYFILCSSTPWRHFLHFNILMFFSCQVPNSLTTLKTMAAQAVATAGVENISNLPKQFGNLSNRGKQYNVLL